MKRPSKASSSATSSSSSANEIYLTTDGGVRKTILTHGTGPDIPSKAYVTVHYVLRFEDGKIIDSSRARNSPFSFQLGSGSVILGWEKAIQTMKKGEKSLIRVEPDYGYGKSSVGPIPGNTVLFFEVEMIDAQKDPPTNTLLLFLLMLIVITVFLFMTFNYIYPKAEGNIEKAIEGLEEAIFGGHA